ncbi:MAG: undecaprenyl/decaprenyl-phosphate alpha-N-acetylglucosaminyl 1-phosphate transferase [Oceanospirillaceae bacterium]|nr:undecaprenyl/decaprenyl-phosphate alpha-N-acetylglucosaminyl 1-phosphate transferase [Oceanospirillaceae bacterium]
MESIEIFDIFNHIDTFVAFLLSLASIPILRRFAPTAGLVDHPGGRKKHSKAVPLVGGVAIFLAVSITSYLFGKIDGFEGLFFGSLALFVLGLLDDRFDIPATPRLITQTLIISIALYTDDVWLTSLGHAFGIELSLGWVAYPLTVVAILGVTNAINMLDGLDGLASGIIMLTLFFILGVASISNSPAKFHITITMGAVVGFWLYNYRFPWRSRATVFMGDSGTVFLGFSLPYLAIYLVSTSKGTGAEPAYLLWLFALPLWDISAVILKRLKEKKSPLKAGRDHIHHILLEHGFNVRQAVLFIYGVCGLALSFGTSLLYFNFNSIGLYCAFAFALYIYIERMFKYDKKQTAEVISLSTTTKSKYNTNA